jgi:hypothetical protein
MIPIKINNQRHKIKSIAELTTKEFIELAAIKDLDVVKYISWQLNVDLDVAFFAVTSKTLERAIGVVPDIRKLPRHKSFDYTKTIQTVGQRHQIEESHLEGFPLLVFTLAVSQACSTNIDNVKALQEQYMERPFTEILPSAFFFFRSLHPGKHFVRVSFERLQVLTQMLILKGKRVLKR